MFVLLLILSLLSFGLFTLGSSESSVGEGIQSGDVGNVPEWAQKEGFAGNSRAVGGARPFAESGCTSCHTYLGSGSSSLGAPDLTTEGRKGRGIQHQIAHLRCPACTTPGSPMPAFKDLGARNLRLVAVFLEASKGPA